MPQYPEYMTPYPKGWFAVAFANEVLPKKIIKRKFMGSEIVIFRTASGIPCAMDAYCPHLGAHFADYGAVINETIRCKFHGFCFDTSGRCVSTDYGSEIPPSSKVGSLPIHEENGALFVYYDPARKPPEWTFPVIEQTGWTPAIFTTWDILGHVQDFGENGIDAGHFIHIHKYKDQNLLEFVPDGPRLRLKSTFLRTADIYGQPQAKINISLNAVHYGLGVIIFNGHTDPQNIETRISIYITPTHQGRVLLRFGMAIKELADPALIHPALKWVPRQLCNKLIRRLSFMAGKHDIKQDIPFWENKSYLERPALARGDGPIGKYRKWARQFYPQLAVLPAAAEQLAESA